MGRKQKGEFDRARDLLFQEIHRCGVIGAADEDVTAWLADAIEFLGEQFPSLNRAQKDALDRVGRNYIAPRIPHGAGKHATNRDEWSDSGEGG